MALSALALASLAMGGVSQVSDDRPWTLLAAAFVRFQEPMHPTVPGGRRLTVELYPIATTDGERWREASVDAAIRPTPQGALRPGERFTVYHQGKAIGWYDVRDLAAKPYADSGRLVGVGGWSLPRKYYPYRLVRSRNVHYLANAVYTWGTRDFQVSVQPFVALNVERRPSATPKLLPGTIRDLKGQATAYARRRLPQLAPGSEAQSLVLARFQAFDLNRDRIPDLAAVFRAAATRYAPQRTIVLVGSTHTGDYLPMYEEAFTEIDWTPFDAVDVDGDGWQELVLTGRAYRSFEFAVLQRSTGRKLRRAFRGGAFGTLAESDLDVGPVGR